MTHKKHSFILIPVLLVAFIALPLTMQAQEYSKELFESIRKSDHITLNAMIADGMNVNQKDKSTNTPLLLAAKIGDRQVVDALLSNGADPNIKNKAGATALMLAAKYGHDHVIEQLMLHDADPLIQNKSGIKASRFASAYGHKKAYRMLLDAENEALKGREAEEKTAS